MTPATEEGPFQREVGRKEKRKLKARQGRKQSIWSGFSVFGLIGWSVSIPTVLLGLLGLWLDERYPNERSFTLALLVAGLAIGCLNGWYWVRRKMIEFEEDASEENQT